MTEQHMVPRADPRSYYGRPVIKAPVWKPTIPWYFFSGGMAGASAALSLVADAGGNRPLARRSWFVTVVAGGASPLLLIGDLGRPERFLNMLRVLKPTSPMSVGSWMLAATGTAVGIATAGERLGISPRSGRAARVAAALLGLPLSTYTAALIANTAVPVWHEGRRELPFVFAGSAAASAGAAAVLLTPARDAAPARRLIVIGAALELAATQVMESRLGELVRAYRVGAAGRFSRLARACTIAGGAVVALGDRRRPAGVAGAAAVLAGAALTRWAVFEAGRESARDPSDTIAPQRLRLERRRRAAGAKP
jgi:formate-dependent nitrite reductase membrane component NrfD